MSPCLEFGLVNKTMHKVDECVSLSDLKKLTKIYNNILVEYFKWNYSKSKNLESIRMDCMPIKTLKKEPKSLSIKEKLSQ